MAGAVASAYAASDSPVTLRTKSTLIRAVHRAAFDFFLHDVVEVIFTSPASLAVGMVCGARGRPINRENNVANNQETIEIITELETKIAFLEAANDDLERALLSQHERIDRLDVIVNELRNRIKEQASVIEGLDSVSSEPPPPHY